MLNIQAISIVIIITEYLGIVAHNADFLLEMGHSSCSAFISISWQDTPTCPLPSEAPRVVIGGEASVHSLAL